MPIMSQRAYAHHRGMHVRAVQKAIQSGRISTLPNGTIDSDVADAEWERNTRPRTLAAAQRQDEDDAGGFGAREYSKARAVREHYQARLAKLEFEERVGNLVSKDEVKIAQFNIDRQRRDAMLNIADRVCASIHAEMKDILIGAGLTPEHAVAIDVTRVHTILTTEIRKGLNDYADSLAG